MKRKTILNAIQQKNHFLFIATQAGSLALEASMLIGHDGDGRRVTARAADATSDYACPGCNAPVILKRGPIKIAHFAHQKKAACVFARGETELHLAAKQFFCDAFNARADWQADVEVILQNNRADVLVTRADGQRFAIEVQHSPISFSEFYRRTQGFIDEGIKPLWIAAIDRRKPLANRAWYRLADCFQRQLLVIDEEQNLYYGCPDKERFSLSGQLNIKNFSLNAHKVIFTRHQADFYQWLPRDGFFGRIEGVEQQNYGKPVVLWKRGPNGEKIIIT